MKPRDCIFELKIIVPAQLHDDAWERATIEEHYVAFQRALEHGFPYAQGIQVVECERVDECADCEQRECVCVSND